jgi:hypothetical protein
VQRKFFVLPTYKLHHSDDIHSVCILLRMQWYRSLKAWPQDEIEIIIPNPSHHVRAVHFAQSVNHGSNVSNCTANLQDEIQFTDIPTDL